MPPVRRAGFRYPAPVAAVLSRLGQVSQGGLAVPRVAPARSPGVATPGKMGWSPQVRPIASPPIQAYTRQVQTYIGGYGVASGTTGGQVASAAGTSLTTLTVTLAAPTAGGTGDCLVACVFSSAGTAAPAISGITLGGSADNWASTPAGISITDANLAIWIDPNCKAGQTSIVITFSGGSGANPNIQAIVFEIPGVLSSPLDAAPAGTTGTGTGVPTAFSSGTTGILAQSAEVIVGCVGWANAGSAPNLPGAPWVNYQQGAATAALDAIAAGYQIVSSANPQVYAGSIQADTTWAAAIITLKIAAGANTIGGAQVSLGPAGYGTRWYPNQVNVATAVGPSDSATATGYLNIIGQGGFLFQSYAGGGDQIGLAVPEILPGNIIYVIWKGSRPATAVQAVILGTQSVLAM